MAGKLILLSTLFSCGVIQSYPLMSNDVFIGELNDRPIIAVLAQAIEGFKEYSYIAASYVKYLESAGARVVPNWKVLIKKKWKKFSNLLMVYYSLEVLPNGLNHPIIKCC